ncbi:MAG: cupredoxin domain-containing protein [Microbacterium sp.]|jgi:iron uptake system component EfeO|nr:cupredoxin domain-containing protein [Microbacterium sp.]
MSSLRPRALAATAGIALSAFALAGCVAKADTAAGGSLSVTADDSSCAVSADSAVSGTVTFAVENSSSKVNEFYLLASDGLRIIGEVENIAPGSSRTLTIVAQPGDYFTVCKPGMIGDGVGKSAFTVTGDVVAATGDDAEQMTQAVDLYAAFVKEQVSQLVPQVQALVDAYESGDDETARSLFASTRVSYERIEPIAEALGDLDPRIDYREVDAVAEGLDWTGFHRIEKDLWVPAKDALNSDDVTPAWQDWNPSTTEERKSFGDQLVTDVQELFDYVHSDDFSTTLEAQGVASLSNGAIALLDEVAKGKITGEEDWWSHTDLSDFAANVEGSKMAFSLVEDFAVTKGDDAKKLVGEIADGYANLEAALASYGSLDTGFVSYLELTDADRKTLTDEVNALAEPLSQLTSTILE